jgi:hypothetical protein
MKNQLREHAQFDQNFESYPAFDVIANLERLYEEARYTVFETLLSLDMDVACATIAQGTGERDDDEKPMFVGADEGTVEEPILTLITGTDNTDIEVKVDPARFDRTNPNHEELLKRCARLVQAISQSPSGENDGNPVYAQVECLRWAEHLEPEAMIARWARLAEIWAAAIRPA